MYNKITQGRSIIKDYKEVALTTNFKHNSTIGKASQFFLKEGPLAILPFSKKMFSVVWSVKASYFNEKNKLINNILGSRIKNNLFRLTFSHSSTEFNGNNFDKTTNLQFRWNRILNEDHSLFLFVQTGESARSYIDERTLFGVGLRQHLYKKDKNYFDIAVGPFYEFEAYPKYTSENVSYNTSNQKTTRISFNVFSSVKLFENVTSATTLYTQWKYDEIGNVRVFGNQYIKFKINEKLSTYVRYVVRYRSINYIKSLKNDTDFMYGLEINI